MHLATCPDIADVALAVKRFYKEHRHLVAVSDPLTTKIHLFGTNESDTQALIEARTEKPNGEVVGQWEYLPTADLTKLAQQAQDPRSKALKSLGLIV